MDGTILGQGTFTVATGVPAVTVAIPSNADFMWVKNFTQYGANSAFAGIDFYWQRGMANGSAIVQFKNATSAILGDTITTGGFTLFDPSVASSQYSANIAITTGVSNATRPVVTTTNTTGLVAASSTTPGSVVRIQSPGFPPNGIDFTVGAVTAGVSFTLLSAAGALATAPGAAGTLGNYQIQNFNPLFYPRRRFIASISQATQAVVATTVPHGLTPGQSIRFNIPAVSGMVELNATPDNNYLTATVVSISATDQNIFTINIDTTGFTAFTWPTSAQQPSSYPILTPVGEDTATALLSPTIQIPGVSSATLGTQIFNTNTGILADSTVNTGFLGMTLGTGGEGTITGGGDIISGPAGNTAGDVVFWVAGKSTFGGL